VLLILSAIIGLVAFGFSGIGVLGIAVGAVVFVLGLPGALIGGFIHGEVSYAQDAADYRQICADIAAYERAEEHEYAEDFRSERLTDALTDSPRQVYVDNRKQQVFLQGGK